MAPPRNTHVIQPRAIVEVDECVAGVFGLRRHSKERGASLINLGRLVEQPVNLFGEGDESAQLVERELADATVRPRDVTFGSTRRLSAMGDGCHHDRLPHADGVRLAR